MESSRDRYPGSRPFREGEQSLFFGRSQESRKLYSIISARNMVVLFAKSGIGKSSLINAGLLPMLDNNSYLPLKIRFQDTDSDAIWMIRKSLEPYLKKEQLDLYGKTDPQGLRIWEYLRSCQFGSEEQPLIPLIILDQFEEFFEHPAQVQQVLIEELADLLAGRLPLRVQEQFRSVTRKERSTEFRKWHSPVAIKIIFSIRSDRLSLMDELAVKIPTILHNRMHLKPMQILQATDAIRQPALLEDTTFTTPVFEYPDQVLGQILNQLKNKDGEVECFQMQLLCRHIENQVKVRYGK